MTTKARPAKRTPAPKASAAAAPEATVPVHRLSKADIFNRADSCFEDVPVPEWGGIVRIKGLTGEERDAFEASTVQTRGKNVKQNLRNLRARLVAASAVDEDGVRLFEPYDIEELGKKSAAALDRLFTVAQKLSKLSEEDVDELVEDF